MIIKTICALALVASAQAIRLEKSSRLASSTTTLLLACEDEPATGFRAPYNTCASVAAYCQDSTYGASIRATCPKSCGTCGPASGTGGKCADQDSTGFQAPYNKCAALKPYCNHQRFGSEIQKVCPLTCGVCKAGGGGTTTGTGTVQFNLVDNALKSHTSLYKKEDALVARRGDSFTIGFSETPSTMRLRSNWRSAHEVALTFTASGGSYIVTLPADMAIGSYTLLIDGASYGDTPIYVLFNPWLQGSETYTTEENRKIYVQDDTGYLWLSSQNAARMWRYDQHDVIDEIMNIMGAWADGSLGSACYDSASMNPSSNSYVFKSAALTTRFWACLSGKMLAGNWQTNKESPSGYQQPLTCEECKDPYWRGKVGSYCSAEKCKALKEPWVWSGSRDIIQQYVEGNYAPVRYGQCWVFAGLLTALQRGVGIPTRPITNIQSAHGSIGYQSNYLKWVIDPSDARSGMVWNFHVWVESWITRDSVSGFVATADWNAADSTPQEATPVGPFKGNSFVGPTHIPSLKKGDCKLQCRGSDQGECSNKEGKFFDGMFVVQQTNALYAHNFGTEEKPNTVLISGYIGHQTYTMNKACSVNSRASNAVQCSENIASHYKQYNNPYCENGFSPKACSTCSCAGNRCARLGGGVKTCLCPNGAEKFTPNSYRSGSARFPFEESITGSLLQTSSASATAAAVELELAQRLGIEEGYEATSTVLSHEDYAAAVGHQVYGEEEIKSSPLWDKARNAVKATLAFNSAGEEFRVGKQLEVEADQDLNFYIAQSELAARRGTDIVAELISTSFNKGFALSTVAQETFVNNEDKSAVYEFGVKKADIHAACIHSAELGLCTFNLRVTSKNAAGAVVGVVEREVIVELPAPEVRVSADESGAIAVSIHVKNAFGVEQTHLKAVVTTAQATSHHELATRVAPLSEATPTLTLKDACEPANAHDRNLSSENVAVVQVTSQIATTQGVEHYSHPAVSASIADLCHQAKRR